MSALVITADASLSFTVQESPVNGLGSGRITSQLANDFQFANGTGANATSQYWSATSTATAAPDVWTLSALTDTFGRSIPFAKIRGFAVWIPTGTDGQNLQVRWPNVASPVAAPTAAASGSDGTVPAGTYLISYTWTNAQGETTRSPDSAPLTVSATNHITVTLPALPTGATGANVYLTTTGGASSTETRQNLAAVTGTSYTILSLQVGPTYPTANTCFYRGYPGISPAGQICTAGGAIAFVSPLATANPVTATTADRIAIDPGASTIAYELLIFGE